jgi:hypothetical protein
MVYSEVEDMTISVNSSIKLSDQADQIDPPYCY